VETLLQAGMSMLPLAPISAVGQNELPKVIQRIGERLEAVTDPTTVGRLWTATKVYLGLRYEAEFVEQLLQGVHAMKESTTYQAILEEGRQEGFRKGRQEGLRRLLLRSGTDHFGTGPSQEQQVALEAITDPEKLEELALRTPHVGSWAELLEQP